MASRPTRRVWGSRWQAAGPRHGRQVLGQDPQSLWRYALRAHTQRLDIHVYTGEFPVGSTVPVEAQWYTYHRGSIEFRYVAILVDGL